VSAGRQERVSSHQAGRSMYLNEQASWSMKMDR
jgi:hypothetical protein